MKVIGQLLGGFFFFFFHSKLPPPDETSYQPPLFFLIKAQDIRFRVSAWPHHHILFCNGPLSKEAGISRIWDTDASSGGGGVSPFHLLDSLSLYASDTLLPVTLLSSLLGPSFPGRGRAWRDYNYENNKQNTEGYTFLNLQISKNVETNPRGGYINTSMLLLGYGYFFFLFKTSL